LARTRERSATRGPERDNPDISLAGGGGGGGRLSRPALLARRLRVGVPSPCAVGGGAGGGWEGLLCGVPPPADLLGDDSAGDPGSGMYW